MLLKFTLRLKGCEDKTIVIGRCMPHSVVITNFSIYNLFIFRNKTQTTIYIAGEPGKSGTNKPFPGPPGPKGAQGAQGVKGEKGQDGTGNSGVKYVRWGRTTCPRGAQIVYKGKGKSI